MCLEILYIYTVESDDDILEQRSDPGNFFLSWLTLIQGEVPYCMFYKNKYIHSFYIC